ncbi:MAG: hypothetical protein LBH07_04005 [Treponema sp.]|jgi:heme/copper-type cytochrome/quinol oxidase subunit 2|nr:hypothetical protein [Treponema sp.]
MIFAGFAAIIPVGLIAFLALSKRTSPAVKKASIIALIITAIVFIACTIIILVIFGSSAGTRGSSYETPIEPVKEINQNIITVLITAVIVIILITLVIITAIREQQRK